jgi:hypothetical protein
MIPAYSLTPAKEYHQGLSKLKYGKSEIYPDRKPLRFHYNHHFSAVKGVIVKKSPVIYETLFSSYFGISLRLFWHPITGFDIIKFDDFCKEKHGYVEDGKTSLKDFLTAKHGKEAATLIENLISL